MTRRSTSWRWVLPLALLASCAVQDLDAQREEATAPLETMRSRLAEEQAPAQRIQIRKDALDELDAIAATSPGRRTEVLRARAAIVRDESTQVELRAAYARKARINGAYKPTATDLSIAKQHQALAKTKTKTEGVAR